MVGVLEASSLSEMHNGLHEPDLDGPDEYPDELKTSFVSTYVFTKYLEETRIVYFLP